MNAQSQPPSRASASLWLRLYTTKEDDHLDGVGAGVSHPPSWDQPRCAESALVRTLPWPQHEANIHGIFSMHAPFEMTDGLEKLRSIIAGFPPGSAHWNEAQNRFQFVDRLLAECLGWERPNVTVEETDEGGGRADYVLGSPAKAVLEAKREAKLFNALPTGQPSRVRKLKPLMRASPDFESAINQVLPYCARRGAPIGIVCNGPQLAVFQAITIGQEPLEGECYFFHGFQSYLDEFPLLWTLLSPEGITENRAYRDLARHRNPRIPPKASQAIPEPNRYRYRDALQEELRSLASILLEEIEDNPDLKSEFYKQCYVPIEANNRHLLLSKQIIGSRYKRVGGDGIEPASLDSATRTGTLSDQYTMNASSRPIVVIGDVGVGKTSFFENLYLHIDKKDKADTFFINIDLGTKANLTADVKTFVLDAIPITLRDDYGIDINSLDFVNAIYHEELKAFDKSAEGQLRNIDDVEYQKARIRFISNKASRLDSHLHASLAHISRGRKQRIILVIDNADQRTFEIQQEAFLIAQELAKTRNLFVFVALRPSTFYLSKTTGALSAYQNKILTISPPPADEVIQKRISFALRVAEGKAAPAALEGIRLNLGSIVSFLRATLRSVRQNEQIRQFLSNITGGNTRAVMELITTFCGSPNVDARKIVEIETDKQDYLVPLHEFTKHALLGEFAYYNPQSSLVACNTYDVSAADPREHFLSSIVVSYLSSNLGQRDNDGFVSGEAVANEMLRHGFLDDQIRNALRRLASKRLIETPYAHFREIAVDEGVSPLDFYYRATSIGIYHVRFWIGSFSFLDATSTDTPIFDEASRSKISSLAASFEIHDRFEKTMCFREYLENRWHLSNIDASYFDLPNVLVGQARSFELVERVVNKRAAFSRVAAERGPSNRGRGRWA